MVGKILLHIRNRAKRGVGEQVWFVRDTAVQSTAWCNRRKILQFLFSFKLGKFKLLYEYEHFFFLKTGNLIIN